MAWRIGRTGSPLQMHYCDDLRASMRPFAERLAYVVHEHIFHLDGSHLFLRYAFEAASAD